VRPFIPARFEFLIFGLLVSGMMSLLVSGVAMFRAVGLISGFISIWLQAWMAAWAVAFLAILFVVPLVRRVLSRLVIRN
jgi:hypothetical protein